MTRKSVLMSRTLVLTVGLVAGLMTSSAAIAQKVVVTLSTVDDPTRFAAFYAIQQGLVKSETVDLQVSFASNQAAVQAFQTKQYDIAEIAPTAIPPSVAAGFKVLITSLGATNDRGAPVVVRADSPIKSPTDLKGRTIGIPSLTFAIVVPLRYSLAKAYGLDVSLQNGDVRWQEVPPDVGVNLVRAGKLDAALGLNISAWKLSVDPEFRTLFDAAEEFVKLTHVSYVGSVLVTYPEVAEKKRAAIAEVNRMLKLSVDYARSHQDEVISAVSTERKVDKGYLKWYSERYDIAYGPLTPEGLKKVEALWQFSAELGTLKQLPDMKSVTFNP